MDAFTLEMTDRLWWTDDTFEMRFARPAGFDYLPGQKIGFVDDSLRRDYTLLGPLEAGHLAICVRHIPGGRCSPRRAGARPGERFTVTAPFGYFTFKQSAHRAVWVATGTGIAPFVAFVRAGARGFDLLHGAHTVADLYYRDELSRSARRYVPCISGPVPAVHEGPPLYEGRVGPCLAERWSPGCYDFYLCGRGDMIRDVMAIIDTHFEGAHVFTERFY